VEVECAFIPGDVTFPNDWLRDATYMGSRLIERGEGGSRVKGEREDERMRG
jgi:hypothetical protein